jgi:hypothetical protein
MPRVLMVQPTDFDNFDLYIRNAPLFRLSYEPSIGESFQSRGNFDLLTKKSVLIYTVEALTDESVETGYRTAYVIDSSIDQVMMYIINSKEKIIEKIRQTPQMAVMKIVGDIDKVVKKLVEDLDGEISEFSQESKGKSSGSYLCLTEENIDKTLVFNEIYPKSIYTTMSFESLMSHLARYNLKYVNVGLENNEWYEMSIKIYDSYGRFEEQYKRLVYVIDTLNLGLIAGESWGTDAAMVFLAVGIYKIKLFTYMTPIEIKRVLVALEYDREGNRLVDFDLYYRKKKIHWDLVKFEKTKGKEANGIKAREAFEKRLESEQIAILDKMENELR